MTTTPTAKTQYIDAANGVKVAYRRIGRSTGIPLVMHIHFRANMDFWDPALINAMGAARPVIIFDQAGVGRSTGEIPTSFQEWADDLIAFVTALGITQIDLFGFSMGGAAVQMVALTAPKLVRRLIIGGSSTSVPDDAVTFVPSIVWPRENPPTEPLRVLATAVSQEEVEYSLAYSFFPDDTIGRSAAAKAYWKRVQERNVAGEPRMLEFIDKDVGAKRQLDAYGEWSKHNPRNAWDRLAELKMPVLVANGDNDVLIPSSRSWEMMQMIPGAQLVIYPHSGHGYLYQYAELVAKHVNMFLDGDDYRELEAKL
jgi:pimeloyl-ACP methyl ester carboxylesterase